MGFKVDQTRPTGWTHVVLNYIGPNDGEGIRVYYNGTEVANATTNSDGTYSTGDGRIVVGRYLFLWDGHCDMWYPSLQIDELTFFNKALSTTDITAMYNGV